jgi:hypothetical protein
MILLLNLKEQREPHVPYNITKFHILLRSLMCEFCRILATPSGYSPQNRNQNVFIFDMEFILCHVWHIFIHL